MAAIDKTYLTKWSDYQTLEAWCKQVGEVTDDWGNKFSPLDWLRSWTKEEWMVSTKNETHEVVVWNTSIYMDIYLIRYCPIDFIQERLKEQYAGGGWTKEAFRGNVNDYDAILHRTSEYDKYQRNGVHQPKFKWNLPVLQMKNIKHISWWVEVDDEQGNYWNYDETGNYWYCDEEVYCPKGMWTSNMAVISGKLTKRKLARILRKWNLPKGVTVSFGLDLIIKGKLGHYGQSDMDFKLEIR